MQFYRQAAKAAAKRHSFSELYPSNAPFGTTLGIAHKRPDAISLLDNDKKIKQAYGQLSRLKKQLQQPAPSKLNPFNSSYENELPYPKDYIAQALAEQTDNSLSATTVNSSADLELQQLNGMLDKVLAIQHPEKLADEIKRKATARRKTLLVNSAKAGIPVSLFSSETKKLLEDSNKQIVVAGNRFYGLSTINISDEKAGAFPAIIYGQQSLVNGATAQLMLTQAVTINGMAIPKNSFVFGKVSLQGERLLIEIKSIRYKKTILPVNLSLYDLDGLKGIYIPGAINRDVAKESSDRAIQSIGLSSLNPSLGTQAAAAGMEMAKTLWRKKVKLIRVNVPSGYQVLLYDEAYHSP